MPNNATHAPENKTPRAASRRAPCRDSGARPREDKFASFAIFNKKASVTQFRHVFA
jgi:hypothetical protein